MMKRYSKAKAAQDGGADMAAPAGGADFGPKYQAHVGEMQRQLDEARAALEQSDARLADLAEERQALSDELAVLKGMGGSTAAGALAGSAAAELAALNLGGGGADTKAIEQRISAVLAEKGALEAKLARMEASYKQEVEALKAVSSAQGVWMWGWSQGLELVWVAGG